MTKSTYTKPDGIQEHIQIQEEIIEMMPSRSIEQILLAREILDNSEFPYKAATELLEALESMLKTHGEVKCHDLMAGVEARIKARAAIAKATGK